MESRNFRYLFENTDEGIVHSGCIWNKEQEQNMNFAYVCGMWAGREESEEDQIKALRFQKMEELCHIFVLGSFSLRYVRVLLDLVQRGRVETVLLPYLMPRQRMALLQRFVREYTEETILVEFMRAPYFFLKYAGVEHVYFLYDNGELWTGEPHQMVQGHYFEPADSEIMAYTRELEGCYVPLVKAGYIVKNDWLFYFGSFGQEMNHYQSEEDILNISVTMFQCPLLINKEEMDNFMIGKPFTRQMHCEPCQRMDEKNCFYRCIYEEDYTIFRNQKKKGNSCGCFGTLSVGNVNMERYLNEFNCRYRSVMPWVRAVTIPKCGSRECWNRKYLSMISGEDTKYWICGIDHSTSSSILAEALMADPKKQIVTTGREKGYCFSGYLVPLAEEGIPL